MQLWRWVELVCRRNLRVRSTVPVVCVPIARVPGREAVVRVASRLHRQRTDQQPKVPIHFCGTVPPLHMGDNGIVVLVVCV